MRSYQARQTIKGGTDQSLKINNSLGEILIRLTENDRNGERAGAIRINQDGLNIEFSTIEPGNNLTKPAEKKSENITFLFQDESEKQILKAILNKL